MRSNYIIVSLAEKDEKKESVAYFGSDSKLSETLVRFF